MYWADIEKYADLVLSIKFISQPATANPSLHVVMGLRAISSADEVVI